MTYEGWSTQGTWSIALKIDNDSKLFEQMLKTDNLVKFLKNQGASKDNLDELLEHFETKRKEIGENQ